MNVLASNTYLEDLNNVFSQAPMSIKIIRAKDYIVEYANKHYLNLVDKKVDIIGKPLFETFPELSPQGIKTIIDKVFETGESYIGKEFPLTIIRDKVSERAYFDLVYKPVREADGNISKLILVATDVTEQVNLQIKCNEAEHLYHELIYSSPFMMAVLKGESMMIAIANDAILESWGKGKNVVGKSLFEVLPETVEQGFDKLLLEVYKTGIPFFAYEQAVDLVRDGAMETMYYNFVYQPQRNVNGKIEGVAVIATEVSNQALLHQQVEESEQRFRHLLKDAPIAICILRGAEFVVELANKKMLELWGKKSEQVMNKPIFEAIPEVKDQGFETLLRSVFTTGERFLTPEYPANALRNGVLEYLYLQFEYQALYEKDGSISGVMSLAYDITDLVNTRKKIEEKEQLYHELIFSSPSLMSIFKGENMIIDIANDAILESWGKGKDIIGKSLFEVMPELIEQGFDKILQDVYKTGVSYHATEMPVNFLRFGNWELIYFTFVYQAHRDLKGEIDGVAVIANEVTSQALINRKIKESESHFRIIAEMIPEKVTNAPPDGSVIFYNKSWLDYTGASFDELINEGWGKWIHPDDVDETHKNWNHAWKTGTDFDMELRILNHLREYKWHVSRARPVKGEDGRVKLWIGTNTEIHEQKQQTIELEKAVANRTAELEKKNKELQQKNKEITETREKLLTEYSRSLIEASLDPLFVISPEGKITDMNQAAIKVTGVMRQKLTGTNFYDYFTDPKKAREIYKEVFLKGFVTDYPLTIKDHVLTDVLFNGSIYKDEHGNVLGAVVVARDITELKRVEKQLYESKENAENAQKIAESATKSKQQFLSNMSHEIRTPMNAIIGFTKVMLKTELDEKQKEYLSAIELSGDALIVLINDILDLAKVEAGKMTFEKVPFKLSSTISSMLHLFEPKLQEKNIKLIKVYDKGIPEVLLGDPIRLNQVMLNLLSNAVKFTSEGKITVSVELLEEDEKMAIIQFSIKDTGIGIKKENLETIFGSFQQASNDTTRLFGGTGLGLSIVKQLIEPQGGYISVESEINIGSTFTFVLSFLKTKAKVELSPDVVQLDMEIKGIKVLVVEDMVLNQLLMKTVLEDFGFGCEIAVNGKVALEKLYENPYDIILMDLQMPEMNGFEATKYIRNTIKLTIPIIALTADVTTVDVGKCKQAGMDDYVAKPINEKMLYSKMVSLLKNAIITSTAESLKENAVEKAKCTNLTYLNTRTKSNPKMIKEMIEIYLEQTPTLITLMRSSFNTQDWKSLSSAVHKMIPSFSIMGMNTDFEEMARRVQEFANTQLHSDSIEEMVLQLETVCGQACEELKEELRRLG